MNNNFPPSSPIIELSQLSNYQEDPFYQFPLNESSLKSSKGFKLRTRHLLDTCMDNDYPTPNPSSTIGKFSSPIRNFERCKLEHSFRNDDINNIEDGSENCHLVEIILDSNNSSQLLIGRKNSICDIRLPHRKNISRIHAGISYIPLSNFVRLECRGTNGLIVTFPKPISLKLAKRMKDSNVFELVTNSSCLDKVSDNEKVLTKQHLLVSFTLLKGETVIMPFIEGTSIDFRQCKARLSLRDSTIEENDIENTIKLDGRLTPIKIYPKNSIFECFKTPVKVLNSPKKQSQDVSRKLHEVLSNRAQDLPNNINLIGSKELRLTKTPESLYNLNTPSTPKKNFKDLIFTKEVSNYSIRKSIMQRRRIIDSPTPIRVSKKIFDDKSKYLDYKNSNISCDTLETGDILQGIQQKGINCEELQHVLANYLAFSNIQQVPLSQLRNDNPIISTLSHQELKTLLLQEQCIGVIYRTGKDASGKELEEEYYYDLENDINFDRKQLVISLKGGRSGLRSCRKVHKQYFWKKPSK